MTSFFYTGYRFFTRVSRRASRDVPFAYSFPACPSFFRHPAARYCVFITSHLACHLRFIMPVEFVAYLWLFRVLIRSTVIPPGIAICYVSLRHALCLHPLLCRPAHAPSPSLSACLNKLLSRTHAIRLARSSSSSLWTDARPFVVRKTTDAKTQRKWASCSTADKQLYSAITRRVEAALHALEAEVMLQATKYCCVVLQKMAFFAYKFVGHFFFFACLSLRLVVWSSEAQYQCSVLTWSAQGHIFPDSVRGRTCVIRPG